MLMENKFGKISRITACAALKNGKTILEDLSFTAPYKIMAPFEKDFSIKKLTRKNDLNRRNSNNPSVFKEHILNCTNAWIDGKGIDDFLRPVSVRKNKFNELKNNLQTGNTLGQNCFENTSDNRYADEKNLFYNCYIRINGVWDKLTYENELYQFYLSLQGMKRNVVVVSEMIPKPDTDEIAKIKRGNYRDVYQLVKELQVNIQFPERPSVRKFLVNAFADVILDEAKRLEQNTNITNINKILNKAVYLLCFINRYQTALFKGLDEMQQLAFSQTLTAADFLLIALVKLAALVLASASGFRGGRIFPAVFVGVALGLMLHAHVDAVPAAITVSCAILGMVLVVTRDGWLSLFMAAVVVPDTTLLPLLCMVMLPAWLLLAGRPLMIAKRHTD